MLCICMIIYCWAKFDSLTPHNYVDNLIQANEFFFICKLALLHIDAYPQKMIFSIKTSKYTRVIFYVRRIGLYLYEYRIYGTISIYILEGLASVYQLI